ncbi:MAG: hypothetical protein MUC62_09750 [Candidatus Thermoplasmatota archaeon]|nr:hypothetical protein [Candidatus Thermoplasmatota archaeon]
MGEGRKKVGTGTRTVIAELVEEYREPSPGTGDDGVKMELEIEPEDDDGPKDDEETEELNWDDLEIVDIPDPLELMKDVLEQAWKDGKITEDEQGLLDVLRKKLGVSDEDYTGLLMEGEPEGDDDGKICAPSDEEDEDDLNWDLSDLMEEGAPSPPPPQGPPYAEPVNVPPPPETLSMPDMGTVGRPSDIITLRTSVRGERPLSHSFDLVQKEDDRSIRRCPSCNAQLKLRSNQGSTKCPLCGCKIGNESVEPDGLRKILDMAKEAYKGGNIPLAKDLYTRVLASSPNNKEALFYCQKLGKGAQVRKRVDLTKIRFLALGNQRLDSLLKGGIELGSQVLIKGPPFCGKDLVVEMLLASSLRKGLPVIYVSSNRAMKEVVKGITEALPEFKEYNRDGMVRMFDLFSRHSDDMVLKEGHRIFNIQDKADFLRFQNDLIMVQEEMIRTYGGGVLIISSLSPIINHADQTDLMKFLQVLIARSKSYNFTNLYDLAVNVHPEEMTNSVEYLMDGIAEFREKDGKYSLRLKGFKQGVVSKDWIDYSCQGRNLVLTSSFHEQRIL